MHLFSLYLLFDSLTLFFIPAFLSVIFTIVVTLNFILFIALIFNMFIKLTCIIIGIFITFLIHVFIIFLSIIFRIYYFLAGGCFFSLTIILLLYVFVNILHVSCLFFLNSNDYNLSSGSVFFRVDTDIDKDADCSQSNNNDSLNNLWLLFATLFFFLKV